MAHFDLTACRGPYSNPICEGAGRFLIVDLGKPAELKFERFILLTQEPRGGTTPSPEMDVKTLALNDR